MGMKVNGTTGLTFPDTTTLASAGQASVRAWVNFNGTGTVAIRASYNVTSITDNGVGDYTLNFTTAMPDVNYAGIGATGNLAASNGYVTQPTPQSVSAFKIVVVNANGTANVDYPQVHVAIFR